MNANPMGDRRDTGAGLQRLRDKLCLELIRPTPAKLPRRPIKALRNRFDHVEGCSSRTGADIEAHIGSQRPLPISDRQFPAPDGVFLPLTLRPATIKSISTVVIRLQSLRQSVVIRMEVLFLYPEVKESELFSPHFCRFADRIRDQGGSSRW